MQKSCFYIPSQNCTFQNSCPPVCLFYGFFAISCDFCKYEQTSKYSTEASFQYFLTRPKYVTPDVLVSSCLNLQTLICTQKAQKLVFSNFELCKKYTFLCLLGAQYYIWDNIFRFHVKHISASSKHIKNSLL